MGRTFQKNLIWNLSSSLECDKAIWLKYMQPGVVSLKRHCRHSLGSLSWKICPKICKPSFVNWNKSRGLRNWNGFWHENRHMFIFRMWNRQTDLLSLPHHHSSSSIPFFEDTFCASVHPPLDISFIVRSNWNYSPMPVRLVSSILDDRFCEGEHAYGKKTDTWQFFQHVDWVWVASLFCVDLLPLSLSKEKNTDANGSTGSISHEWRIVLLRIAALQWWRFVKATPLSRCFAVPLWMSAKIIYSQSWMPPPEILRRDNKGKIESGDAVCFKWK